MVSHAQGHVNWTAQFLVPPLILAVLRLRRPGRAVRGGVVLGLLVAYQAFVNEEVLFYTALALGLFVIVYAPAETGHRAASCGRSSLRGLLVALVVAGALLAYPLWVQFFGPQRYHGVPTRREGREQRPRGVPRVRPPLDRRRPGRPRHGWRRDRPRRTASWAGRCCSCARRPWRSTWRRAVTWALLGRRGGLRGALARRRRSCSTARRTGVPGPWALARPRCRCSTRSCRPGWRWSPCRRRPGCSRSAPTARWRWRRPGGVDRDDAEDRHRRRARRRARAAGAALDPGGRHAAGAAFVTDGGYGGSTSPPGTSMVFVPVTNNIHLTGMRWSARSEPGLRRSPAATSSARAPRTAAGHLQRAAPHHRPVPAQPGRRHRSGCRGC